MVRSANANLKNREITENNHLLSDIRDELYVTALDNFSIINAIYQGITDNKLVGRDWELWKPILTIAQLAEPSLKLYEEIRDFAITSTEETRQTILDTFLAPKIIQALLEGFKDDDEEEFFSFSDIELLLSRYDTDSFSWLADKKHRKHISTELRKAGVTKGQSVPKRVGDEVVKGYWISKKKLNLLLTGFG
jgi:hypothetical protein